MNAFERELTSAVEHADLDAVIATLAKRGSGALAAGADPGTAKGADIILAARLIRSRATDPADRFQWVKQLLTQPDFNGHQLGLVMLSDVYDQKPKTVLQLLQHHADSANWAVREYAGTCAGRILDQNFRKSIRCCKRGRSTSQRTCGVQWSSPRWKPPRPITPNAARSC